MGAQRSSFRGKANVAKSARLASKDATVEANERPVLVEPPKCPVPEILLWRGPWQFTVGGSVKLLPADGNLYNFLISYDLYNFLISYEGDKASGSVTGGK